MPSVEALLNADGSSDRTGLVPDVQAPSAPQVFEMPFFALGSSALTRVVVALVVAFAFAFAVTPAPPAAQTSTCAARPPVVGTVTSEINEEKIGPSITSLKIVSEVTWKCDEARESVYYKPTGTWTFELKQTHQMTPGPRGRLTMTASASGSITPFDGLLWINPVDLSYRGYGGTRTNLQIHMVLDGHAWDETFDWNVPWMGGALLGLPLSEARARGKDVVWTVKPDGIMDDSISPVPSQYGNMMVHWHFAGELPGLELLIVDSQSYDGWRPKAGMDTRTIGNDIKFEAKLQGPDGSPAKVKARKIIFELIDTSREPGICMNWPQDMSGRDNPDLEFDLRFVPTSNPPDRYKIIGPRNQRAETVPGHYTSASAVVSSFDWGAWSTLKVTAELEDGRPPVVGHFRRKSGPANILLPKRAAGSKIADQWKQDNGVSSLPDDDDSETDPVGEPGAIGDGLTLYEEYRGFFENGGHISGDPKHKDLFIFNKCGAVAIPGIDLFQRLSGLVVHKDLLEDERNFDIPNDYTAINGYFTKGPHRVLQHRVEILSCAVTQSRGGGTRTKTPGADGRHLRPKDVENVFVEGPGLPFWEQQYGVNAPDKPRQFEVALAHELLHTVGVDHHGEGDGAEKIVAHSDGPPAHANARWEIDGTPVRVRLLDEATGADITESSARRALQALDARTAADRSFGPAVENPWYVQILQIGNENGQHSGDTGCVMRYWLADAYPMKGVEHTYYLVPPGSEPVGTTICSLGKGTTINAPRTPQPRYFDAAPTRGNCRNWICVNDAIPGKSSEIPWGNK